MGHEQSHIPSPQERTSQLFSLDTMDLAERLKPFGENGMIIALPASERRIRVSLLEPYSQVGDYYKAIQNLRPGNLWNPAKRAIAQSLVIARSEGGNGSCVRLLQAEFYDPQSGEFEKECTVNGERFGPREGAIAKYLGLEKGSISELSYRDESEILFVTNIGTNV